MLNKNVTRQDTKTLVISQEENTSWSPDKTMEELELVVQI
jgi:hypothetical protein